MGWISVSVAAGGALFTVLFWLIRRRVSRLDELERAVFGNDGVRERLHKYVTQGSLDQKLADVRLELRGISEEGQLRETRILAAIENQTLVIGSEVREIKTDLRAQALRVDAVMQLANSNAR